MTTYGDLITGKEHRDVGKGGLELLICVAHSLQWASHGNSDLYCVWFLKEEVVSAERGGAPFIAVSGVCLETNLIQ